MNFTARSRLAITVLAAFILPLFFIGPAGAACDDPAGPGVDWSGCLVSATDLSGTDFTGANLAEASLGASNLAGANFTNANLTETRFTGTNLTGAVFTNAQLVGTRFVGSRLDDTDFRGVKGELVIGANVSFVGANFEGAEVTDAFVSQARFCRTVMPDGEINNSGCP